MSGNRTIELGSLIMFGELRPKDSITYICHKCQLEIPFDEQCFCTLLSGVFTCGKCFNNLPACSPRFTIYKERIKQFNMDLGSLRILGDCPKGHKVIGVMDGDFCICEVHIATDTPLRENDAAVRKLLREQL
mgnify:FL=1